MPGREELEPIAPYPNPDGCVPLEKINKERKWSVEFGEFPGTVRT